MRQFTSVLARPTPLEPFATRVSGLKAFTSAGTMSSPQGGVGHVHGITVQQEAAAGLVGGIPGNELGQDGAGNISLPGDGIVEGAGDEPLFDLAFASGRSRAVRGTVFQRLDHDALGVPVVAVVEGIRQPDGEGVTRLGTRIGGVVCHIEVEVVAGGQLTPWRRDLLTVLVHVGELGRRELDGLVLFSMGRRL